MNKVRRAIMHAVVMAIMAQALTIVYIVARFREMLHRLDVVDFQVFLATAILTSVSVALKHCLFPSEIVGATPALRIPSVSALGYALTLYAAIGFAVWFIKTVINQVGIRAAKFFAANSTGTKRGIGKCATSTGAIYCTANMRWGTQQFFATMLTSDSDFLRLCCRAALTTTESLFGILGPRAVGLFRDYGSTGLASFQFHAMIIARA